MKLYMPLVWILCIFLFTGCTNQSDNSNGSDRSNLDSNSIRITFISTVGDDFKSTKKAIIGEKIGELPIPKREGYKFMGWFDKESGGKRLLKSQIVEESTGGDTGEATYYGQWEEKNNSKSKTASKAIGVPVLMYHWFYEGEPDHEQHINGNWMPMEEFTEQMEYLHDEGFYFPSWTELEMFIDGDLDLPEKSIVITDDDGKKCFFDLAIPVIRKNDITVTSFVITSNIKNKRIEEYMDENIHFGSHSHLLHKRGDDTMGIAMHMNMEEISKDLRKSQSMVDQNNVFCYPFGHFNDKMEKALTKEGFTMAVTTYGGKVYPGIDKLEIPRVRMSSGTSLAAYKKMVNGK